MYIIATENFLNHILDYSQEEEEIIIKKNLIYSSDLSEETSE